MRLGALISTLLLWIAGAGFVAAQQPTDTAAALLAEERARVLVADALEQIQHPYDDPVLQLDAFVTQAFRLAEEGSDVVPLLISELEQDAGNFFFVAYALGLIPGQESEQALRKALARAERGVDVFAQERKIWAAYGLALQPVSDAVDLGVQGDVPMGHFPVYRNMCFLEAAALLNPEDALPRLHMMLKKLAEDPLRDPQRLHVMRAIRRIADVESVPWVADLMQNDLHAILRASAARTLRVMGTPAAVAALVEALSDDDQRVRFRAAESIAYLGPPGLRPQVLAHLEEEANGGVRGQLYLYLAELGSDDAPQLLAGFWGRPAAADRIGLVMALGRLGSDAPLATLSAALDDSDNGVALAATLALTRSGSAEAQTMLLSALRRSRWAAAGPALRALVKRQHPRVAAAAATRLVDVEGKGTVTDTGNWIRLESLSDALVELEHVEAIDGLRAVIERQNLALREELTPRLTQLETIRENGTEIDKWIASARSADPGIRQVAYAHLGRVGGAEAVRTLIANFGRVDAAEGSLILQQLGELGGPEAIGLIRRVLSDPAFDHPGRSQLRNEAAWAARRIGGAEMREALIQSARRREGRDFYVLAYLALLAREDALPILDELRTPRTRYLGGRRGDELDMLERIVFRIRNGRSLKGLDVPPRELQY